MASLQMYYYRYYDYDYDCNDDDDYYYCYYCGWNTERYDKLVTFYQYLAGVKNDARYAYTDTHYDDEH